MIKLKKDKTMHRPRVRLAPAVRSEKILDSALSEFAQRGFASTRVEDIARGAGLVKSGFYAHFHSKEEVFEALLTRYLVTGEVILFDECDTVADFVDRFLDHCYSLVEDPRRQAMLRLLLAEAHRVPDVVAKWRAEVVDPVMDAQLKVLQGAVERRQLVGDPLLDRFSFAYAPLVYWVLSNGFWGEEDTKFGDRMHEHRELHRRTMLALLRAPTLAET